MKKTIFTNFLFVTFLIIYSSCNENGTVENDAEKGWKQSTTANVLENSTNQTQEVSRKDNAEFKLFNDINLVRDRLSSVGIGRMTEWKFDDYSEYYSITTYYEFGGGIPQNNLAYYLDSESPNYIKTLKLVVNINNSDKKSALSKFSSIINKTYAALDITPNQKIISAAKNGIETTIQNDTYSETIMLEQTRIETWKFIIETI